MMAAADQQAKARDLRAMHGPGELLLLPCAWDVTSARVFAAEGFGAIGTTSAGIAATLGYGDGEKAPFEACIAVLSRIARAVSVPVTADIEGGYAPSAGVVAEQVKRTISAGAVGINLEDEDHQSSEPGKLLAVEQMQARIGAARAAGEAEGVPLVVNAKTDAIWLGVGGSAEASFADAVARANAYGDAGADCVFVPGELDAPAIRRLCTEIDYPLNIVAKETTPPVETLRALGVRRLSLGSGPMRATLGLARTIARELLTEGTFNACFEFALPYADLQRLLERAEQ